jgi:hypothetical protein
MPYAYAAESWRDFFLFAGGGAAALTGLAFVGLSIQAKAIAEHAEWRGRARGALIALFSLLAVAGLALIPGQPIRLLGIEVLIWSGVIVCTGLVSTWRTARVTEARTRYWRDTLPPGLAAGLLAIAGVSITTKVGGEQPHRLRGRH